MLISLIKIFSDGPDVSLNGSPTVSPITAALWALDPLPPSLPDSIYFLALSQAAPPVVIEIATNTPEIIDPIIKPPKALGPNNKPTIIGANTGIKAGTTISFKAFLVTISTILSY